MTANAAPVELPAYNTYSDPPFMRGAGGGLAPELVNALNRRLAGAYRFTLVNVPRQRLVKVQLRDPTTFKGIALFLAPQFLNEPLRRQLVWSAGLFEDQNVLIFRGSGPARIGDLNELRHLRLGAVLGNQYGALDEMVSGGKLLRDNATSPVASLHKLCVGRVDFTQMSRLVFRALEPEIACTEKLVEVESPQSQAFTRRVLLGTGDATLAARLAEAIEALPCDGPWRAATLAAGISIEACKPSPRPPHVK